MIEILRRGQLPKDKVYEATCGHCNTYFKFTREEAQLSSDQRDGDALKIKCPMPGCGHVSWVRA